MCPARDARMWKKHPYDEKNTCRHEEGLYKSICGTASVRKGATRVTKQAGEGNKGEKVPESPHHKRQSAEIQQSDPRAVRAGGTDGQAGRGGRQSGRRRAGETGGGEKGKRRHGRKPSSKSIQCYPPRPVRCQATTGAPSSVGMTTRDCLDV